MATAADNFNAMMAADAQAIIVNGEFAESITYVKRNGVRRVIFAVVFREGTQPLAGPSQAHVPKVSISVANDALTGIAAAEMAEGDMVALDLHKSGKIKTLRINTPIFGAMEYDQGVLHLELN